MEIKSQSTKADENDSLTIHDFLVKTHVPRALAGFSITINTSLAAATINPAWALISIPASLYTGHEIAKELKIVGIIK